MTAQRPNFLFIITDQQRADHLSCAGNPVLKTPHLDSLAHRGRRFENFFVNSGICQTNRATIMTGQTITQHGVRVNGIPIALDSVCFPHLLQAGGYETALFGKAHFQNMTTNLPNFRQRISIRRRMQCGMQAPHFGPGRNMIGSLTSKIPMIQKLTSRRATITVSKNFECARCMGTMCKDTTLIGSTSGFPMQL